MNVWNSYNQNNLPIDTLWSDIDYMVNYIDFTLDTNRFNINDMNKFSDLTNPQGVHWVPIVDVGISLNQAQRGRDLGTYIKSAYNNDYLIGCVWPGHVYYPDFNHPNAQKFWTEGLSNLTTVYGLHPSGIWIDMNEYSNFIQGETDANSGCPSFSKRQIIPEESSFLERLKGVPGSQIPFNPTGGANIEQQTLSLNAWHYNQPDAAFVTHPTNLTQFDFHELNGFTEGVTTKRALTTLGQNLTMIISRSTMFGSGKYVQHWTGDNIAGWDFMYTSLAQIMNFNMFGIPFVGEDICGYGGTTWPELCARWMSLGTLYPFSRNHKDKNSISQEPYAFPDSPYVLAASKKGISLRYAILKHYYQLFVRNNGTGTVFKPLFFEFPQDTRLLGLDWEFMIGDSLLVAPCLIAGDPNAQSTNLQITIPQGSNWYDFLTFDRVSLPTIWRTVPFDSYVPLYLREGRLIATQFDQPVMRSRFLNNTFELRVAFDGNLQSNGTMMTIINYDDASIINKCTGNQNCIIAINAAATVSNGAVNVKFSISGNNVNYETVYISKVTWMGISYNGAYKSGVYVPSSPWTINSSPSSQSQTWSMPIS